jgi:hypothetical protein
VSLAGGFATGDLSQILIVPPPARRVAGFYSLIFSPGIYAGVNNNYSSSLFTFPPLFVPGLFFSAEMFIYVFYFLLQHCFIKTVSLIESPCPYLAVNPNFPKGDKTDGFVMLHNKIDRFRDIRNQKMHVI